MLMQEFLTVTADGSDNCQQDCSTNAPRVQQSVPTIQIEMSESSEPEKLHRVDEPPVRTPRVAGSNMLVIQPGDSITYGSAKSRHRVVERTLSADSYRSSHKWLTCNTLSPAHSSKSSRVSSGVKSSHASSVDECSRVSSGDKRSTDCNYMDDFDEPSDVDEGYIT